MASPGKGAFFLASFSLLISPSSTFSPSPLFSPATRICTAGSLFDAGTSATPASRPSQPAALGYLLVSRSGRGSDFSYGLGRMSRLGMSAQDTEDSVNKGFGATPSQLRSDSNLNWKPTRRDFLAASLLVPAAPAVAQGPTEGIGEAEIRSWGAEGGYGYDARDLGVKGEAPDKGFNDQVFSFRGGSLSPTSPDGALRFLARRSAVFLGETHDSEQDKKLALQIIKQLHTRREGKTVLALEMVQQPFQSVLDWYVYQAPPSKDADRALFKYTEWNKRWYWNFDYYLPLFRYCQMNSIRMLALNAEAEATSKVREGGLSALSKEERAKFIMDADGFMNDSLSRSFPDYVQSVIKPSFDAHVRMGVYPEEQKAFQNFVQNRILWDEAMATRAARYLLYHPDTLVVGLVGGDHVKTAHGIPARLERILTDTGAQNPRTASVAMNPSWKLYSESKTLVDLDKREKQVAKLESEREGVSAQEATNEDVLLSKGWSAPPPAIHHPFSDIIWFS